MRVEGEYREFEVSLQSVKREKKQKIKIASKHGNKLQNKLKFMRYKIEAHAHTRYGSGLSWFGLICKGYYFRHAPHCSISFYAFRIVVYCLCVHCTCATYIHKTQTLRFFIRHFSSPPLLTTRSKFRFYFFHFSTD